MFFGAQKISFQRATQLAAGRLTEWTKAFRRYLQSRIKAMGFEKSFTSGVPCAGGEQREEETLSRAGRIRSYGRVTADTRTSMR